MSILAIISMKARQNENEKNKKSKRIDKFLFFRIQCCIVFFFLSSYWNTILSFIFLLLLQTKWLYLNPKKNLKQRYISEKQIDKNCQFHSKKQTKKCIFENKRRMLLNVTFFFISFSLVLIFQSFQYYSFGNCFNLLYFFLRGGIWIPIQKSYCCCCFGQNKKKHINRINVEIEDEKQKLKSNHFDAFCCCCCCFFFVATFISFEKNQQQNI